MIFIQELILFLSLSLITALNIYISQIFFYLFFSETNRCLKIIFLCESYNKKIILSQSNKLSDITKFLSIYHNILFISIIQNVYNIFSVSKLFSIIFLNSIYPFFFYFFFFISMSLDFFCSLTHQSIQLCYFLFSTFVLSQNKIQHFNLNIELQ